MKTLCTTTLLVACTLPAWAKETYRETIKPFFDRYCLDCHDTETRKGTFSLEAIQPQPVRDLESWRMVAEQIRFGDMPPPKKPQPSGGERDKVLAWIRSELLKTQAADAVSDEKLRLPQFGNYVDHRALFGERRPRVEPAPPRIWRLRPGIYRSLMQGMAERVGTLANGLNVSDGSDFKDYAVTYFVDEASATTLLSNAKKVASAMLSPRARDSSLKHLVSPEPPTQASVEAAINSAFRRTIGRKPTREERDRFAEFFVRASKIGGHETAARALLTAILMQPEFLFRQE
ncbi:MAG: DUF1595 domain-containing protein, partial [Planctomycetota bacterium]